MALDILLLVVVLMLPVGIGWRVAYSLLLRNPTPEVKAFFWVMSALFVVLAGAAFVATRFIE